MPKLFFFCLLSTSLFSLTLIEPIMEEPTPTQLNKSEKYLLLQYLEHLGNASPEHYYRISEFYIQTGELENARTYLNKAIQLDPQFISGYLQLGFIDLWEKKWNDAYKIFSFVLDELWRLIFARYGC